MYEVTIDKETVKIEATGVSVESGNILFFSDDKCTQVRELIPSGKWTRLKVLEGSAPLYLARAQPKAQVDKESPAEAPEKVE